MTALLYATEGLFALLGAGVLLGSIQRKRVGLLLPSAAYLLSAAASFVLHSWWPLFLGYSLARLFGSIGVGTEPQSAQRPTAAGLFANHGMHVLAGIIGFDVFLFSGDGVAFTVLLTGVLQGLDTIALYYTYSRLLADQPALRQQLPIKVAWMFVLKVLWYALITLLAAYVARSDRPGR